MTLPTLLIVFGVTLSLLSTAIVLCAVRVGAAGRGQ